MGTSEVGRYMPDNPITRAEFWHGMEQLEQRMDRRFDRTDKRLDSLTFVGRDVFDALKEEVREQANTVKWLVRSLIAAVVFSPAAAVIAALVVK